MNGLFDKGVTLFEIALVICEDEAAAHETVVRWVKTKKITATQIGKKGHAKTYDLFEAVNCIEKIESQIPGGKQRLLQSLARRMDSSS